MASPTPSDDIRTATDDELVALGLAGNERALAELHRRYHERVFQEHLRAGGDWDVADSLTHRTFTRAFDALERYQPDPGFAPWLLRIARNETLRRLGKKTPPTEPLDGSPAASTDEARRYPALQVSDREPNPLAAMLASEEKSRIELAIARLRPDYREAVLLHIEGHTDAEIARKMNAPLNTVRAWLNRARTELKKTLGLTE